MQAGIANNPLLAWPMSVLVGGIFHRNGVVQRMVDFAVAGVGRSAGMLLPVAILVAMVLYGISGSGPAKAAAVGGVMIAAMAAAGYPAPFSASIVGAAAATDILIPPSIAFVVYNVSVPGASVSALFAAGMLPGVLAGLALIDLGSRPVEATSDRFFAGQADLDDDIKRHLADSAPCKLTFWTT